MLSLHAACAIRSWKPGVATSLVQKSVVRTFLGVILQLQTVQALCDAAGSPCMPQIQEASSTTEPRELLFVYPR